MLDLDGDGLLALWNGVEPERAAEYDLWHSREHVSERISVPGMYGARRYVRIDGPLPEYLTLYPMRDLEVLKSPSYLRLLNHPTDWSRAMRPSLCAFMRLCCHRVLTVGGGAGSALAACMVEDDVDLRSGALHECLERLVRQDAFTALHVIENDASIPGIPFSVGGDAPAFPRAGAILFESYDEKALAAQTPQACDELRRVGLHNLTASLTCYRLAYSIDRASLNRVVAVGPPSA